jgi:hypothetical protein
MSNLFVKNQLLQKVTNTWYQSFGIFAPSSIHALISLMMKHEQKIIILRFFRETCF